MGRVVCVLIGILLCLPGVVWGAASVCGTPTHGAETAAGTSHTINIPAACSGSGSGELIIVLLTRSANNTTTWPNGANDSSTAIYVAKDSGAGVIQMHGRYRVANGSDSSTWGVTTSDSIKVAYEAYRVTGYTGTPEAGTAIADAGAGTSIDPPSITPSWGNTAASLLFVQMGESGNSGTTISDWPDNYATQQSDATNAGTACTSASAYRVATVSSEDPNTWTISAAQRFTAQTIAIQSAATTAGGLVNTVPLKSLVGGALAR